MRTERTAGFTLLELLVVIAILAATATVVGPRLNPTKGGGALRSARSAVAAQLAAMREAAIHDGRPRCLVASPGTTADCRLIQPGGGVEVTAAPATLRFFGDGSSTGGSVTLHAGTAQAMVTIVSATGEIVAR